MAMDSKRVEDIKYCCNAMKKHQQNHKTQFLPVYLGTDKNKDHCTRGKTAIVFRYCSRFIRKFFKDYLLDDNKASDWCVLGRHNSNCCFMDISIAKQLATFNISEALHKSVTKTEINNSNHDLVFNALMNKVIGMDYPSWNENTQLQVHVNGKMWIQYYLKMSKLSTIQKTCAPSGYRYKDRISFGKIAMIQGNSNKDLVLFITQDMNKKTSSFSKTEHTEPVVNGVGFWNLTEAGGIRNIIHLNERHCANLVIGFYVRDDDSGDKIESIKVSIVPNNLRFGGPFELFSYDKAAVFKSLIECKSIVKHMFSMPALPKELRENDVIKRNNIMDLTKDDNIGFVHPMVKHSKLQSNLHVLPRQERHHQTQSYIAKPLSSAGAQSVYNANCNCNNNLDPSSNNNNNTQLIHHNDTMSSYTPRYPQYEDNITVCSSEQQYQAPISYNQQRIVNQINHYNHNNNHHYHNHHTHHHHHHYNEYNHQDNNNINVIPHPFQPPMHHQRRQRSFNTHTRNDNGYCARHTSYQSSRNSRHNPMGRKCHDNCSGRNAGRPF